MDIIIIFAALLAVGLLSVIVILLIGELALVLAVAATVMLDLGANLSAVLVGRPRSHRL